MNIIWNTIYLTRLASLSSLCQCWKERIVSIINSCQLLLFDWQPVGKSERGKGQEGEWEAGGEWKPQGIMSPVECCFKLRQPTRVCVCAYVRVCVSGANAARQLLTNRANTTALLPHSASLPRSPTLTVHCAFRSNFNCYRIFHHICPMSNKTKYSGAETNRSQIKRNKLYKDKFLKSSRVQWSIKQAQCAQCSKFVE